MYKWNTRKSLKMHSYIQETKKKTQMHFLDRCSAMA